MKITKSQLRQLIHEEVKKSAGSSALNEYSGVGSVMERVQDIYQKIQALQEAIEIIEMRLDGLER